MASPPRTSEREEERHRNTRTLVIASLASATAAVVTSQLWIAGTWIAAAMTPVIVALVSEMLNRPTERIARSISTSRTALPVAGAAEPPSRAPDTEAPVRVYRSGEAEARATRTGGAGTPFAPTTRRRKIAYGAVFGTAALAFLIAVVALTVPELVTGGSIGKNSGRTTFFSGDKNKKDSSDSKTPADTTTDQTQPEQQPEQQQQPAEGDEQSTTPSEQPTTEQPAPDEQTTTPPGEPLPQATPPDAQP